MVQFLEASLHVNEDKEEIIKMIQKIPNPILCCSCTSPSRFQPQDATQNENEYFVMFCFLFSYSIFVLCFLILFLFCVYFVLFYFILFF